MPNQTNIMKLLLSKIVKCFCKITLPTLTDSKLVEICYYTQLNNIKSNSHSSFKISSFNYKSLSLK